MFCDGQTSSGLLVAVTRDSSDQLLESLQSTGILLTTEIDEITSDEDRGIKVSNLWKRTL